MTEEEIKKIIELIGKLKSVKNYTIIEPNDTQEDIDRKVRDILKQSETKETLN